MRNINEVIETTVADTADNAEVALEKKHQGEVLRGAMTKLSREHREIIHLVYYHENSVDDAADPHHPCRYREDPHVLCPQEARGAGPGSLRCCKIALNCSPRRGSSAGPSAAAGNAAGACRLRARGPEVLQVRK